MFSSLICNPDILFNLMNIYIYFQISFHTESNLLPIWLITDTCSKQVPPILTAIFTWLSKVCGVMWSWWSLDKFQVYFIKRQTPTYICFCYITLSNQTLWFLLFLCYTLSSKYQSKSITVRKPDTLPKFET